jgi:S1-C subfamily serine protease
VNPGGGNVAIAPENPAPPVAPPQANPVLPVDPPPVAPVAPPVVPANPPAENVAAAPADPAGLRYRWDKAPHVYRIRVETEIGNKIESHEGICIVAVRPGNRPAAATEVRKGTGTGFVVNANGYLVTCAHVVAGAKTVDAALGGKNYRARVLAVDHDRDLALIQIDARALPALALADSEAAEIGQEVRAIGFPLSSELGDSLKATRGTLSGIDKGKAGKVFHVDAPINPGNSGGPLMTEAGEVLGVTSAKLTGPGVSNVGFVTPGNDVKKLLASKDVASTKGGGAAKLDGPALVRKVSPSVALITVTLGPDPSAETYHLTSSSGLFKQQPRAVGSARPAPPKVVGTTSAATIHMNSAGAMLEAKGGNQLPLLLGEVGQFLIEPLPPDGRPSWEIHSTVTVGENGAPAGPRGFRPHMYGNRPIGPKGPKGPQAQPKNVREATEATTYRRGATAGNVLTILKQYEMNVPAAGTSPAMKLAGKGEIRFDTRAGMPREIDYKATLTLTDTNSTVRVPVTVTYTLIEGAERELILNPPPPPKIEPKAYNDAEMVALLAELNGADDAKKWAAVDKLGKAKVTTRRDEVARALDPLTADKNNFYRVAAINALVVWGTKANVPTLLPILADKDGWARTAAVKALGQIGDERAIEPIAKLLPEWFGRGEASEALRKAGSKAEKAVLPFVKHKDWVVRSEACKILGEVGTKASKEALEEAAKDRNPSVHFGAKAALEAIAKRP